MYSSAKNYFKYKSKHKDIVTFENEILMEEKTELDKWNFYGKYFCLINEKKELNKEVLNELWNIIPSHHLIFTKKSDNEILFTFKNNLTKNAFKKSIEFEVKEQSLKELINSTNCSRIEQGIYEEKLLTLFFKFNKLNIINLHFLDVNIIEVEELYQFINSKYEKHPHELLCNEPIIITQSNYNGKYYDIIILVPININDEYEAIFVQIGLNKTKKEVQVLENDIKRNKLSYINGIKKFTDKTIKDVYLIFIFDKETLLNKIDLDGSLSNGVEYCLQNNIKFFLFSLEDYYLYEKNNNSDNYESIEYFNYKIEMENEKILGKKRAKPPGVHFFGIENIFGNDVLEALFEENREILNSKKINITNNSINKLLNKKGKKCILLYNNKKDDIFLIINNMIKKYSKENKFVQLDKSFNSYELLDSYEFVV